MQNLSGKRTESKKIQKKNSRGTKKAVRRNEKIPEARFFAVFFNQSHVLQDIPRKMVFFFSKRCGCVIHIVQTIRRMEREKRKWMH